MTTQILETAIQSAVKAGDILIQHYGKVQGQKQKESLRDVVTEVDQLAEAEIVRILQKNTPQFGILTEENGFVSPETDSYWIVDALDGTANFIHNIPFFGVSVAFIQNQKPVAGAIYNPLSEELYYGEVGIGCFKNQKRLHITDASLSQSLLSQAFSGKSYLPEKRIEEFMLFGELNDKSQGCLRTGSAAINLAYVADSKLGGCFGKATKFWDIAAGLLFAELAGASVRFEWADASRHQVNFLAAAPTCFKELQPILINRLFS